MARPTSASGITGPDGLTFTAKVGKLSRIVPMPRWGRRRGRGRFRLNRDGFSVEGRRRCLGICPAGLQPGPRQGAGSGGWKGRAEHQGRGDDEGGGGHGLLAVLGASPSAQFEGARLKDGRFLIRSAKIQAQPDRGRRRGRARHPGRPVLQGRRQGGLAGAGPARRRGKQATALVGQQLVRQALDASPSTPRAAAISPPAFRRSIACSARRRA
jgi:hypothetical protein